MTDSSWNDELTAEEINQIDALLADPQLWDEPDSANEDAIVAAILAETANEQKTASTESVMPAVPAQEPAETGLDADNVVSISRARRWFTPALGVAAGVVLALLGVAALSGLAGQEPDGTVELALAGTELAPAAEATARIVDLPAGTRILLDVSMLQPAPPGSYYEAWLRKDAEVGVSAGTFHLRGGDGEVELWAGVSTSEYPLVTVTIQEEAEPTSSGRVVLKGLLDSQD